MASPAVFLDKDGTILEDVPYNIDPAKMRFLPGAAEGLRQMHQAGLMLIVISNQSGIAKGFATRSQLVRVETRLREMLGRYRVPLAGFYYCPHDPEGRYAIRCDCRKPAAGMIEAAIRRHNVDRRASWMVGDILDDVEAGKRAGCRTILIRPGGETLWQFSPQRTPQYYASDLREAALLIRATSANNREGSCHDQRSCRPDQLI